MQKRPRVAIIGAGFTGLSAAVELCSRNIEVKIFEAKSEVGGLARGFANKNWKWRLENFYHHIFTSDEAIIEMAQKVGARLDFSIPVTAALVNKKQKQLDSPVSVLKFDDISFWGRVRMGLGLALLKIIPNGLFLEQYKTAEILPMIIGKEGYEMIWKKLLTAKFGSLFRKVNLAWFWSRVAKRSQRLGYFEGGFQTLADKMAEYIEANGGKILLNTKVQNIEESKSKIDNEVLASKKKMVVPKMNTISLFENTNINDNNSKITLEVGFGKKTSGWVVEGEEFDRVIVTTPEPVAEKMIKQRITWPKIDYLSAQVLVLELKNSLMDNYWLNILEKDWPFLVVVEHTKMIDQKNYDGKTIVYIGNYLEDSDKRLKMEKKDLLKLFLPFVKKINPQFDESWILESWPFLEPYAQPVFPINYSKLLPETNIGGLYIANMSMVYPFDRGTNYAVKMGVEVAQDICKTI